MTVHVKPPPTSERPPPPHGHGVMPITIAPMVVSVASPDRKVFSGENAICLIAERDETIARLRAELAKLNHAVRLLRAELHRHRGKK